MCVLCPPTPTPTLNPSSYLYPCTSSYPYVPTRTVMLSSRFVGSARGDTMGGRTLKEHCNNTPPEIKNYTFSYSKQALADLGFIEEVDSVWQPHAENEVESRERKFLNLWFFGFCSCILGLLEKLFTHYISK
jgi:hypothetical protein